MKTTEFIGAAERQLHELVSRMIAYNAGDGKHQELEGPDEARKLLTDMGTFSEAQIERICWLVGHHHTYDSIIEIDYQILVEADFLVNIYEDNLPADAICKVREKIFKTSAGRALLDMMFGVENDTL